LIVGRVVREEDPPAERGSERASRVRGRVARPGITVVDVPNDTSAVSKLSWNVLPFPGSLSTVISPPIAAASRAQIAEAETGAAESARGRGVGLDERLKEPLPHLGGHAHAGVLHGEAQQRAPGTGRFGVQRDPTLPISVNLMALLTRFTRIWRMRVGSTMTVPDVAVPRHRELEHPSPRRGGRNQRLDLAQELGRRPRHAFHLHLAASIFESRGRRSRASGGTRRCGARCRGTACAPLAPEPAVRQELGVAEDRGQRRPDLVAHVGEDSDFARIAPSAFGGWATKLVACSSSSSRARRALGDVDDGAQDERAVARDERG